MTFSAPMVDLLMARYSEQMKFDSFIFMIKFLPSIISLISSSETPSLFFMILRNLSSLISPLSVGSNDLKKNNQLKEGAARQKVSLICFNYQQKLSINSQRPRTQLRRINYTVLQFKKNFAEEADSTIPEDFHQNLFVGFAPPLRRNKLKVFVE